jgi:hypothetical protein
MVRCDRTFVGDFDFGQRDLPGGRSGRTFWYPGASRAGGPAGALVGVEPAGAEAWIGMFASGHLYAGEGAAHAIALPDRMSLLITCNGASYTVAANDPHDWAQVGFHTVRDPIVLAELDLVLLVGWTDIKAWGPDGEGWETTTRLYDDLEVIAITGNVLKASGSSPPGTTRRFTVDLRTGASSDFEPLT